MAPTFTVIIPTFNRAAMLRQALDSVAAQSYQDYETVVVDDGSTEDVAEAVMDHVTRPRMIRQNQRGPAAARNRGVMEARGKLVAFLDSDDLWLPDKLSVYAQRMRDRPDTSIWYGPMKPVDSALRPVPGRTKPCHGGQITEALFHSSFVHVPTVVCPRETFLSFGGFDESLRVCEDYDLWLRMSLKCEFGLVESPLALRRLHRGRLSKSSMRRNLAVKAHVLQRFYESNGANAGWNDADARRRLSRVHFAAGRAAWWAGAFHDALRFFRAARSYGAQPARAWPLAASAFILRMFERAPTSDAPVIAAPPAAPPVPGTHSIRSG